MAIEKTFNETQTNTQKELSDLTFITSQSVCSKEDELRILAYDSYLAQKRKDQSIFNGFNIEDLDFDYGKVVDYYGLIDL